MFSVIRILIGHTYPLSIKMSRRRRLQHTHQRKRRRFLLNQFKSSCPLSLECSPSPESPRWSESLPLPESPLCPEPPSWLESESPEPSSSPERSQTDSDDSEWEDYTPAMRIYEPYKNNMDTDFPGPYGPFFRIHPQQFLSFLLLPGSADVTLTLFSSSCDIKNFALKIFRGLIISANNFCRHFQICPSSYETYQ